MTYRFFDIVFYKEKIEISCGLDGGPVRFNYIFKLFHNFSNIKIIYIISFLLFAYYNLKKKEHGYLLGS